MKEEPKAAAIFTQENRVKLYYRLLDFLPAPVTTGYDQEGGEGLRTLDELLRRKLGRLKLARGRDIQAVVKNFVLAAPEDELLALVESVPLAHYMAEKKSQIYSQSPIENAKRRAAQMREQLNNLLSSVGCSAEFLEDGTFSRDGTTIQTPVGLRKLPDLPALQADVERQLKQASPLAVIAFDLDGFKSLNDTLGHAAGDRCLEKVVEIISRIVLKKGKLYRRGGDEFVVMLPNCVTAEALATAERILLELDQGNPGESIKVSASIGVISSRDSDTTLAAEFLSAADQAMYLSKRNGKNRVTAWSASMSNDHTQDDGI